MRLRNLHAYVVPKNDAFMSQNLPKHKDHLNKLSGFTGSAGFAIVRSDGEKGMFVTDSRYEIAVKTEVDHDLFQVSTKSSPVSKVLEDLAKGRPEPLKVGLDGHLFTKIAVDSIMKAKGIEVVVNLDD